MPRLRGLLRWPALLVMAGLMAAPITTHAAGGPPASPMSLTFADQTYLLRWSSQHQHEFTPKGQHDLSRWTDMVTINYRRNGATVLCSASMPRTAERPAEHLALALFPTGALIEAVFGRWRLTGGRGTALIYSLRHYGQKAGDAMAAWLQANGPAVERQLMGLQEVPSHRILEPAGP